MGLSIHFDKVLRFWFEELTPKQWWIVDAKIDKEISARFSQLLNQAAMCELFSWRNNAEGRLAEIIVLDQFSRNIYRGTPKAFSQDSLALALSQEAVRLNIQEQLQADQHSFLYMPYMHSESKAVHEVALTLFERPEVKGNYDFEVRHKAIIDRFGRYPHRNVILGRESTPEEIEFLKQPGSSF